MKTLIAALLLLSSPSAFAWEQVLICDSGSVVIDAVNLGIQGRQNQLVIRDPGVTDYLLRTGAVRASRRNLSGELILSLKNVNYGEYAAEEDAYQTDGRVVRLRQEGDSLLLEAFRTSQPTGGFYAQGEKIVDWTFRGCR